MLIKKEKILTNQEWLSNLHIISDFLTTAPQSLRNVIEVTENHSPKKGHEEEAQLPENVEIYQGGERD